MGTDAPAKPAPTPLPREHQFAHLHLHTEYSLLDGGNRIDKLVKRVAELGMTSVGITDHGNIFGHIAFYQTCKEKGIKPILGVEAYVTPPGKPRTDRTYTGGGEGGYHLVLLAENLTGWKNLLVLCSEAYVTGFYYKPRIDRELLAKHSEGLIAINGHLGSEIGEHLLAFESSGDRKYWDLAVESAEWHAKALGKKNFFVELQHHVRDQNSINKHLIKLAQDLKLSLVCDNDAHFLKAEDHDAHDTLVCISTARNKDDTDRMRYPEELYVKSPREMRELFDQYGAIGKAACDATVEIAERCNVELPLGVNHAPMVKIRVPSRKDLPKHDDKKYNGDLSAWYRDFCSKFELQPFEKEPTKDEIEESKKACDAALRLLSDAGFIWRYGPESSDASTDRSDKTARLERELKILCDKNIAAYFLIVWDFVNWGRQNNVPALARGSGVGTMVGYVLGLSNACPVRYGLLFERFTDPDRTEYPDIDIDLCQDGRADVINYVRRKYGHVAQIITFGTMKARAAVRDVGRVFNLPLSEVDKIAKLIPEQLNITIEDALEKEPDLRKLYENDQRIARLLDNARTLEGQARHASVHAAGVIVATRPLHEIVPLFKQPQAEEHEIVTQWDGPTCEKMGLLKMDFLGLRTISIVARAQKLIRESMSEEEIWAAVGRRDEYLKWQSGRVAKGQSGDESGLAENQDVSRSNRLATGNAARGSDVSRNGKDAKERDVRAHKPASQSDNVHPDEHSGGIREAHQTGIHTGTPDGDGVALRDHDRLRNHDESQDDPHKQTDSGAVVRRRSPASIADHEARGKGRRGSTQQTPEPTQVTDFGPTPPLRHSATSPLPLLHPLDLDRLNFDDQTVFELFRRGETTGVFQFESPGMRRLLVEMKPDRLEDLIAANALFRPGPMDLIPDYNRRKHGTEVVPKVHEIVDRYTAETYGVMVYQEQVMQIVHGLGGIKLRDAYTLIKNISKKKHDKIDKERPKFVEGAQKQGLSKQQAQELFELILKFAGYGFNKSHSTGYAIVAYQTAYLKTYFPNQYMAAFLTFESQAQKASDWISYLEDCKKCRFVEPTGDPAKVGRTIKTGVEVRPPDINLSDAEFAVVYAKDEAHTAQNGHVRFGLKAIKGTGDKAIEKIIAERSGKKGQGGKGAEGQSEEHVSSAPPLSHSATQPLPFSSLFDFCERIPQGTITKSAIESLIKCGAFDSVHGRDSRAAMVATIEQAINAGQKIAADRAAGQGALFGFGGSAPPASAGASNSTTNLARADKWIESETLRYEKDILGFFVSSHPMDAWKRWSGVFTTSTIAGVKTSQQDARVIVAGIVQGVRTLIVKNGRSAGQKMAVVTVEDQSGSIECVVFADAFSRFNHLVETDKIIFVLGRADLSRGEPQIVVDRLVPIEGSPLSPGRLQVLIDERKLNGTSLNALDALAGVLKAHAAGRTTAASNGASASGSNGTSNGTADTELESILARHSMTPFPVELAIGTMTHTAILAAPGLRVGLKPQLLADIESALGPSSARIVGGVSVELNEKKPWEKKFAKNGSDD